MNTADRVVKEVKRLGEAATDAYAAGDEAEAERLLKQRAAVEKRAAEPWRERVEGARRAATRAKAEVERFVGASRAELLEERRPVAEGHVTQVERDMATLRESIAAYLAADRAANRLTDRTYQPVRHSFEGILKEIDRLEIQSIPVPIPVRREL